MPQIKQVTLVTNQTFDPTRCRHYTNGVTTVLHCHHYASLYTQLADDATLFDGKTILRNTAENSFYGVLQNYMVDQKISRREDRVAAVEQYWAWCGMGELNICDANQNNGRAEMTSSHVDAGWIKKWGKRDEPVNFITQGYLAAAWSVIWDTPMNTWQATETQCLVSGAPKSVFTIGRK
jgi:predicted hydrocarbon binding protein